MIIAASFPASCARGNGFRAAIRTRSLCMPCGRKLVGLAPVALDGEAIYRLSVASTVVAWVDIGDEEEDAQLAVASVEGCELEFG